MTPKTAPPRAVGKAKAGEKTRDRILKAASDVFARKGFSATTIEDLVSRAGVSRPSMYYHFNGKEDLFRGVLDEIHTPLFDWAEEKRKQKTPLRQLLMETAAMIQEAMQTKAQYGRLFLLFSAEAQDQSSLWEYCRKLHANRWTLLNDLFAEALGKDLRLKPGSSIEDIVRFLIGYFIAIHMASNFVGEHEYGEALNDATLAERVADMLYNSFIEEAA